MVLTKFGFMAIDIGKAKNGQVQAVWRILQVALAFLRVLDLSAAMNSSCVSIVFYRPDKNEEETYVSGSLYAGGYLKIHGN